MEEDSYRQSRLCRLLGNPVVFAVVELLAENKELNPSEIARAVGRSVPRVSNVLSALRLADVVRYGSDGKHNYYRSNTLVKSVRSSPRSPGSLRLLLPHPSPSASTLSFPAFMFSEFRKCGRFPRIQSQRMILSPAQTPTSRAAGRSRCRDRAAPDYGLCRRKFSRPSCALRDGAAMASRKLCS